MGFSFLYTVEVVGSNWSRLCVEMAEFANIWRMNRQTTPQPWLKFTSGAVPVLEPQWFFIASKNRRSVHLSVPPVMATTGIAKSGTNVQFVYNTRSL